MDAVKFLRERERMCEYTLNRSMCDACPANRDKDLSCNMFSHKYPEKIVSIVDAWVKAHPAKTMLMDFKEKYPNAPLDRRNGIPDVCPKHLGYTNAKECEIDKVVDGCVGCWNRPLEEER